MAYIVQYCLMFQDINLYVAIHVTILFSCQQVTLHKFIQWYYFIGKQLVHTSYLFHISTYGVIF